MIQPFSNIFSFTSLYQTPCLKNFLDYSTALLTRITTFIRSLLANIYDHRPSNYPQTQPKPDSHPVTLQNSSNNLTSHTYQFHAAAGGDEDTNSIIAPADVTPIPSYSTDMLTALREKTNEITKDRDKGDYAFIPMTDLESRFTNIYCAKKTHVGGRINGNLLSYDTLQVVATQAPPNNSYSYYSEFWSKLAETGSSILDLTNDGDIIASYFPTLENPRAVFTPTTVDYMNSKEIFHGCNESEYLVTTSTHSNVLIKRWRFTEWRDFESLSSVAEFKKLIDNVYANLVDSKPPLWMHCRAGVGRTGTLATGLALKKGIATGAITKANYIETLNTIIATFRLQRNNEIIQTDAQYNLVYNYGKMLLETT